ncbi:glycosyltransferase family 8 protein [Tortispora caseinolytica NRRL Y-17796]|uniref:glycogenin glucosyltransferase n=1 Tax=Tortispora caseinolytica NRRL Y-17796 TaxID=767744 RepID=A0A1E4TLP8_9ASCO|nr:glycosyltransferase family 8 protein [Tortispora caseinolytica NRRL Y-17796]
MGGNAFFTLLTSDSYAVGAVTLAASLKDFDPDVCVCVLVTADVSDGVLLSLNRVFDEVIEIGLLECHGTTYETVLERPDLKDTLTKLHLWDQEQYSKIVYLDADTLPVKSMRTLFDVEVSETVIGACPDIGWPDMFNSGVMVLKPSKATYKALIDTYKTKQELIDGADQGLLNVFFENNWLHIPFIYNVAFSGAYQYRPAFLHFRDKIACIHFIGTNKPWTSTAPNDLLAPYFDKWWSRFAQIRAFAQLPGYSVPLASETAALKDSSQSLAKLSDVPVKAETIRTSANWNPALGPPPADTLPEGANLVYSSHVNAWDQKRPDRSASQRGRSKHKNTMKALSKSLSKTRIDEEE